MFKAYMMLLTMVFLGLFAVLIVSPVTYAGLYGVAADNGADFLGRRWSPLLLALAVLCWMLRDEPREGLAARAVLVAVALAFGGFALTGIVDFLEGQASAMILVAAGIEAVSVALCLVLLRPQRRG